MKDTKMATMPMNKLILTSGIPVMLSLALQSVYNIVDSAFISNMEVNGEEGLNALTLAFPVQMFIIALCIGTGVGACVLISRYMGEKNQENTVVVTNNTIFLGVVITLIIMIFGVFGVEAYISSQTSNVTIYEMAVDYLKINCIVSFGCVFFGVFEKTLQSTGHSLYSTLAQIVGAIINIILDPILIYGWFGFSAMGVKGAAYATVIGQIVAFIIAYLFHKKYNKHISGTFKGFKPNLSIIKHIYIIGLPAIVAQALISIMAYSLNIIFVMADESIVTVYGLYYKIQQFVIMTAFGLRDATIPIISFTYGTRNKERLKDSIKYLLIYTFMIMIIGTALFEIFATPITLAFGLSGETMQLFLYAIRIISISFVFAGFNVACQAIFQAIDSGVKSLVISFARQIIFVLPVAYAFTKLAIVNFDYAWTVWLTFIIAEFISLVISVILLKQDFKNKINTIS